MPDKIDCKGNYMPFYGYTVVCMASDRTGILKRCEDFIKTLPTLSSCMSPLPASSYHATLYDIFTQRRIPDRYLSLSGLVPSPHWTNAYKKLHQDMSHAQTHCENIKDAITFKKRDIKVGRNAVLLEGILSNLEEISVLEGNMRHVFDKIGKAVKMHHITLGYIYKTVSDDDLQKINEELKGLWDEVQDEILLDKPNVCYFESMKEFVPVKEVFK